MLVLGFPDYELQTRNLAQALDCDHAIINVHRFPDGECKVRITPAVLPQQVVLCRSLDHPDSKLIELLLAATAARDLGATHLTLVAPYLCYMRQDTAFEPGEAVSQRVVGRFLASLVDAIVTVDPHLHRTRTLAEAVPVEQAVSLSAAPAMGEFLAASLAKTGAGALLVGPDSESEQWVSSVASCAGLDFVVADKARRGDRDVEILLPQRNYAGASTILIDDVASTGTTLVGATRALRAAGAARVDVLVTHALLVDDALATMRRAGVGSVWSSDSVSHPTNAFSLTSELARAAANIVGLPFGSDRAR